MQEIALVLLPGLDGTGVLFRPLLGALPPEIRPRVQSFPRETPTTYEELLPGVIAALPRELPFALLGESYSGPLALVAAATRPPGLRAVILCASFVRNPVAWFPSRLGRFVGPLPFRLFPFFTQVKALLGRHSTPALRALSKEALSAVHPSVLAARVRSVLRVDVTAELRACTVPVLYLRGEHDHVVRRRSLRLVRSARPTVQVVSIPASHLVLQTQPEAAARAIAAFLAAEHAG